MVRHCIVVGVSAALLRLDVLRVEAPGIQRLLRRKARDDHLVAILGCIALDRDEARYLLHKLVHPFGPRLVLGQVRVGSQLGAERTMTMRLASLPALPHAARLP